MVTWIDFWNFLRPFVKTPVIFLLGYILIKIVMRILKRAFEQTKLSAMLTKYILKAIKITMYVFLVLIALDSAGVSTGGIVAALSAGVVAVGLALQDSLGNIAGGIWLLFSPRFSVGDFISAGGCDGTVVMVELMHTILRTPDGKQISIPNGILVNDRITNFSIETVRRLDIIMPIPYETDVEKAKELALQTASKHPLVFSEPNAPFVRVKDYGEHAVNLLVRVWCENKDYWTINFDLTEQIRQNLIDNGIGIPFHQLDVHIKN